MRLLALITVALLFAPAATSQAPRVRIGSLVDLHGIRSNVLTGHGIVMGLRGTGDGTVAARQAVSSYLARSNLKVRPDQVAAGNIALVNLRAVLPPFSRHGMKLDVEIASIGEATSLRGGTLLRTELKGSDNKIYALASGQLMIGGFEAKGTNSKVTRNHPTAGIIPNGAICEPPVEDLLVSMLNERGQLSFNLRHPSATNANRIEEEINKMLHNRNIGYCSAADQGHVLVELQPHYRDARSVTKLLAKIQALTIEPAVEARVILNEKTGTIIAGRDVRLTPCLVQISDLTIEVVEEPVVSQPNPGISRGTTKVVNKSEIRVVQESGKPKIVDGGNSLRDLIQGLQSLGVDGQKMMTVLAQMHAAGHLHAELIQQ